MDKDFGRSPSGPGSQASPEAARASSPSVLIPNATKALSAGKAALHERGAISAFLTVCAARAVYRAQALPFWRWYERRRIMWSAVNMSVIARDIENGEHHEDQAAWLSDISGGVFTLLRASGIEGEAGDAEERLHPEGESAVDAVGGETPNA